MNVSYHSWLTGEVPGRCQPVVSGRGGAPEGGAATKPSASVRSEPAAVVTAALGRRRPGGGRDCGHRGGTRSRPLAASGGALSTAPSHAAAPHASALPSTASDELRTHDWTGFARRRPAVSRVSMALSGSGSRVRRRRGFESRREHQTSPLTCDDAVGGSVASLGTSAPAVWSRQSAGASSMALAGRATERFVRTSCRSSSRVT